MIKSKIEIAKELGRSMAELRIQFRQHIQIKLKEYQIDMTYEMLEVMSFLWQKNGVNQQEIADRTLRDKSAMTYLIDNLVKRNMVTRVADEGDRRNKLIFLTPEGVDLRVAINPWVSDAFEVAATDLSLDQVQQGLFVLNKMIENLKTK